MSLKKKAMQGVLWTGLAKASMQVMLVILMVVLARLLTPADFGVVGMAAIVTVAISMVNDRGLGTAIIQKSQIFESHLSSVFWGGILFSLLLFAISLFASYPLSAFFRNPLVQPVIAVQAIGFVIGSFGIVQKSLLTKNMEFKKLAIMEIASILASGLVSIVLAVLRFGVWSLVFGTLTRDAVNVLLVWIFCRWRPRWIFSWSDFKELFAFSAKVLGNDIASYGVANLDILIIGRLLGSEALGYYHLALNLVKTPVARLSAIVSKVAFPAFSAIQGDTKKMHKGYLTASSLLSIIIFPLLLGLALFAHEFIDLFMGAKWMNMALPLILLIPMGLAKSIGVIRWPVLMALGRPDVELKWNLAYALPLAAVVYFGAQRGLNGAAAGISLLLLLTFPLIQSLADRIFKLSDRRFYRSIAPAALAGAVMVAAVLILKSFILPLLDLDKRLNLAVGIILSGAVYLLALKRAADPMLQELIAFIRSGKFNNGID